MFHTLLSCFFTFILFSISRSPFLSTKTCPRGNCFRKISKSASFPWYLKSNTKINKIPQFFGGGIYKFLPWCYSSGIERQSKNCFRQYTQLNACRKKEIIMKTRIEADSIGSLEVPSDAYYGVQSLRAKRNFPITGTPIHPVMIQNLAKIKRQLPSPTAKHRDCRRKKRLPLSMPVMKSLPAN